MGVSGKPQVEGGLESEGKKWVIAGISLRPPLLKPIYTNQEDDDESSCNSTTTPRGEEARIPTTLTCPPPPRKRKPSLKCNYGSVRDFFTTPPDLESVFIRRV